MHFLLASTVLGLVALTQAVNHAVLVGGPGGTVAYSPTSVVAAVGDTVTFTFQQKNHTITQSSFANPCTPLAGGFDSGFQPVPEDNTSGPFPAAAITIRDTNPIWIYCRQQKPSSHCAAGMVFAINPGDGQLAAFQAAAKATANATANATATTPSAPQSTAEPSTTTPASQASTAASSSPTPIDHKVLVGDGGMLVYNPPNISANAGDTVTFVFKAKNHTVSQSSFPAPCRLLGATSDTPGFDSGFMPVSTNDTIFPTYTITVNDTSPIWAYCRQTNPVSHCASGMVFAVNADEGSPKNFEAFKARALQPNGTTIPNAAGTTARQSVFALAILALGVISGV